eukprot:2377852-Rhodomonas_salina.1
MLPSTSSCPETYPRHTHSQPQKVPQQPETSSESPKRAPRARNGTSAAPEGTLRPPGLFVPRFDNVLWTTIDHNWLTTVCCWCKLIRHDTSACCYGILLWYDAKYAATTATDAAMALCYGTLLRHAATVCCYGMLRWYAAMAHAIRQYRTLRSTCLARYQNSCQYWTPRSTCEICQYRTSPRY